MTARKALAATALLAMCLAARSQPARAQQPPVRLQWSAPPGCPDQQQVLERVRAYLKLDRWPATLAVGVEADARVRGPRGRLRLQLEVDTGAERSVRTLEDADCNVLANGAALLIALALAPALEAQPPDSGEAAASGPVDLSGSAATDAGGEPRAGAPGQPAAEPPAQQEPLPPPPARAQAGAPTPPAAGPAPPPIRITDNAVIPSSRRDGTGAPLEPRIALGAGLAIYGDLAPAGPSLGVELAGELLLRPWRFGLGLGLVPERSDRADVYAAAELRTGAAMLTVWPCYDLALTDLALGVCAYGELGSVTARVRAIDEPQSSRSNWVAAGGGLSLRLAPLRHLVATLDLRALRAADDLHFVIGTPGGDVELHRTGPISLRFALRIAWIL